MKYSMRSAIILIIGSLIGCGGGGGGASTTSAPPTTPPNTTAAIQANMTLVYDNEQITLAATIVGCFRTWGMSGNALNCGVAAKQSSIQNFLNTVLANIQTLNSSSPVDKVAISTMLDSYKAQDLAWLSVNALAPTYTMSSAEVSAFASSYNSSVNTSYSNASIQLAAM
jgi:hypothetical protein